MPTLEEMVIAAATRLVDDAGGEIPEGATYNEIVILAAATIITAEPGPLDDVDDPPEDGTYVLTSTDGVITWEPAVALP